MADRRRTYPGVKGPRPDKAAARRDLEKERLEYWQSLTPAEQLASLDRRLGKDVGAKRQRARLVGLISPGVVAMEKSQDHATADAPKKSLRAKDRRKIEKKSK